MLKLKPIENSKLYQRRTISKENLLSSDDVIVSTKSTLQPQNHFYKNESLIKLNANQAQSLTKIERNKKMESSVQGKNFQMFGFVFKLII